MNSEPSKGVVDSPSYIQNDASNLYQEVLLAIRICCTYGSFLL